MAGNPFFSGRIPKELNQSIIKHCEETGKSKTQVLVEALSNYLNIPIPESSQKLKPEVTKEQFKSLEYRVALLESFLDKNTVITEDIADNKNEELSSLSRDNNLENIDNTTVENTQVTTDNIDENADNENSSAIRIYRNIDSEKLAELANLQVSEKINLKAQAFRKAQKEGYVISKEIKFNPPIETKLRRGISINGNEYKLLCEGTDEKEKPVWSLKLCDNISYQPDILSKTN